MFGPWSVSTVHSEVSEREPCLVYGQCLQYTVRSQRGSHVWSMSVSTVHSEVSEREPCLVCGQCLQCTVRSQRGSHVWSMGSVYSAQ